MSITIDLSPEVEKQLAAMPEDERTRFVTIAIQNELEDPAALACSRGVDRSLLTDQERAALVEAMSAPFEESAEALKEAVRDWKRRTGREA